MAQQTVEEKEQQQIREYLKRAEVKTMRKDLRKLREFDALKERDKIARLKTIEEQKIQEAEKIEYEKRRAIESKEKQKREDILSRNERMEREAEKDLKKYATEAEKQQIFLLESERIGVEDKIKNIEVKKEPELILQKNHILIEQRELEQELDSIKKGEKKREDEENFIEAKEQQSKIPSEKKALEERRSELENKREEIEKSRWSVEKNISEISQKVSGLDTLFNNLSAEKNNLRTRIKDIDNSLRLIYSSIIAREEERRRGEENEQKMRRDELSKASVERKEQIQREQWSGISAPVHAPTKGKIFLQDAPVALKRRLEESAGIEEEQRKKFLENVEKQAQEEQNNKNN